MKRLLFLVLLGVIGAFLFRAYGFEGVYVASASMDPTLPKGTHVFVNKLSLLFREPRRGEIVMFKTPQNPGKGLIKRVIAVGGDWIAIKLKAVYLNGILLEEPYAHFEKPDTLFKGDNIDPLEIPGGYVFVMGDNRDLSGDSRDWKNEKGEWSPYVPLKMVKGVVMGYQ